MSVNKCIIVGNIGAQPTLLKTKTDTAVCRLRIATNERVRRAGKSEKRTMWHDVTVFGATAAACAEYLRKGSQVYVEGKHDRRVYEDPTSGEKRSVTRIIAQQVVFLSGGKGEQKALVSEEENLPSEELSAELEKLSA